MQINLKEDFNILISKEAKDSILLASSFAEKIGIKIYLIGGIVRDLILKNEIKDIDIAVESDAVEFSKKLEQEVACKVVAIQENLRTAKVLFENGVEVDFASTRQERYISSGILPVAHNFGCKLEDDVKRRDFTINTLGLNLVGENKFELVDFYNGYDDIQNKKIRILHNNSFIDDPSRIIRALKFKVRFDFDLEENTYNLMQDYLNNVDMTMPLERIKGELYQYLNINKTGLYDYLLETNAYKLLSDKPIKPFDEKLFNELYSYDILNENEKWFVYVVLLIVNSSYDFERYNMTAFEKKIIKETRELLSKDISALNDNKTIYKVFNNLIDLSIASYYVVTNNSVVKKFWETLRDIKVLISGKDLISLGLEPSPYFNEIFNKILEEKLNGNLKTKEEELKFIQKYIKK